MTPRFCLRCGSRLRRVRDGDHVRPRCPACAWTFYDNPVPAAVAIVVRGGRVLLTRRAKPPYRGTWDVPGGFMEADETPEAALERELAEELAVRVQRARFVGFARDRYGARGFAVLTVVYRVTLAAGPLKPADDVAEARWFPRERLPLREVAFPGLREFLRRYFASATGR